MKDCCNKKHPDHSLQIKNLNRISGQIEGVKKMIERQDYCPDILTQLRAVKSAIKSVEVKVLQKHLEGCVENVIKSGDKASIRAKIDEIIQTFNRFES
jgi:DNA-binding FrmR family transcriptional regulator